MNRNAQYLHAPSEVCGYNTTLLVPLGLMLSSSQHTSTFMKLSRCKIARKLKLV